MIWSSPEVIENGALFNISFLKITRYVQIQTNKSMSGTGKDQRCRMIDQMVPWRYSYGIETEVFHGYDVELSDPVIRQTYELGD